MCDRCQMGDEFYVHAPRELAPHVLSLLGVIERTATNMLRVPQRVAAGEPFPTIYAEWDADITRLADELAKFVKTAPSDPKSRLAARDAVRSATSIISQWGDVYAVTPQSVARATPEARERSRQHGELGLSMIRQYQEDWTRVRDGRGPPAPNGTHGMEVA